MKKKPTRITKATSKKAVKTQRGTRTDQIVGLLSRPAGASIAEMMKATGWQAHSVRGFMSGHLKKQGRALQSGHDEGGTRRYRLEAAVS